jgi:lipopolysaccharide transport system ATP-binding protein
VKPIIKVEGVSKQYRLVAGRATYATVRDAMTQGFKAVISSPRRRARARSELMWALQDISFDVFPGEVIAFIGRNGAGKSTLLKILSRITEPTAGRVDIYGTVGSLLEVGTGFHPELTGRENIYLNGAILGMKRTEISRKFDELVAFAEIERFLDTPVKHYSSGMYMRLAFSVAAHLEPEILLVDEVLAVGDAQFQKKCLGKMGDVAKAGRTVVFVSHNMDAVRKLCTRGLLLEKGRVSLLGSVEAAIKEYIEGGTESQSTYLLAEPEDGEAAPGYATKLVVEDGGGTPASAIPVGQPWQIRVHFKIKRRVEHFIVALGMTTGMNAPLRTSWSAPGPIEPGEYEAVFREDTIMLAAGRYSVTVGLSNYERSFHYVENAGTVEIADYAEGVDLLRVSNVGYILNPFQIELRRSLP